MCFVLNVFKLPLVSLKACVGTVKFNDVVLPLILLQGRQWHTEG
jgi:hypothetical protein